MSNIDWEILIHGVDTALQGLQHENKMLGAATGMGIGMGAVFMADGIMDHLMGNPDSKKSPVEAAVTGTIEDTISTLAMSVMLDNPITMTTVGLNMLYGLAEGTVVHTLEGEVDWNHNWLRWN